jgi:hypothetical protein
MYWEFTPHRGRIMSDQNTKRETKKTPSKSDGLQSPSLNTSNESLPKKIVVMGRTFRIERAELDEDVGDMVGLYRRIRISDDVTKKQAWQILTHEWAHAVLYVNGISNVLADGIEEVIAQSFEHAVEELIEQIGPQLVSIFSEEEKD